MTIAVEYGRGVVALPEAVLSYIDKASPLALRLFLLLVSDRSLRENFSLADAAKDFAVTPQEMEQALNFWVNAGLISFSSDEVKEEKRTAKKPKLSVSAKTAENGESVTVVTSGMPNYTGKEIEAMMQGDESLALLVEECQRIAGKMFGVHEITRLLGMADYLRFDHDSILLLFAYAGKIGKCSVAYVEKMATSLVNEGITSYGEVEAYLSAKEKQHTLEGIVRKLAGVSQRAFSAKEKKFLAKWGELAFSESLLTLAYEVTVDNTGAFSFPYMNKVLLNWHEAGYTTAEEVNAAIASYREKKEETRDSSFDVDEFFEAALKRGHMMIDNAPTLREN
ncbi:MAG: DnaD domain protein [Clostridia bacterium]|nr:DnaD domain protein [Clostridia bacterium]